MIAGIAIGVILTLLVVGLALAAFAYRMLTYQWPSLSFRWWWQDKPEDE